MKTIFLNYALLLVLAVFTNCNSEAVPLETEEVAEEKKDDVNEGDDNNNSDDTTSIVAEHGQLKVLDGKIVDKNNEPLQLRGMSFFWSQWIGKYYTPETVKWLKNDWQATIVRAAMAVEDDGGYITNPEENKQRVFTVVDAAIEAGIYVIIDWHSHFSLDKVEEAKAFFSEVAKKYKDVPNVIFEPYNEPINVSWKNDLKPYHEQVIAAIRAEGNTNLVICGTRTWSQRVDDVIGNTIDDDNVAYTLHYYASTHKQDLRNIAQTALNAKIPIFVTEFGVTEASGNGVIDVEEATTWWTFLDENKISWCNWSVADKEENSAALKPNTSTLGGWGSEDLTQSGTMVREEMRAKNPKFN
ncbi:glycoside hydrolase family 5 protein [Costertonia aggregata]|uniref:Glycoside hydrolase family 5 protein n=1 Tax=Costertonia aggregata TaxID=343403 RepID=A0A7H9AKU7_9FLAO|nr:glycoside hydrolase family 5 protein [Costertonia aggregata]QLG44101.1 glycoside hydrolase family 5 protein [Costertonia aggregata]